MNTNLLALADQRFMNDAAKKKDKKKETLPVAVLNRVPLYLSADGITDTDDDIYLLNIDKQILHPPRNKSMQDVMNAETVRKPRIAQLKLDESGKPTPVHLLTYSRTLPVKTLVRPYSLKIYLPNHSVYDVLGNKSVYHILSKTATPHTANSQEKKIRLAGANRRFLLREVATNGSHHLQIVGVQTGSSFILTQKRLRDFINEAKANDDNIALLRSKAEFKRGVDYTEESGTLKFMT